jgi:hypothetical protein
LRYRVISLARAYTTQFLVQTRVVA